MFEKHSAFYSRTAQPTAGIGRATGCAAVMGVAKTEKLPWFQGSSKHACAGLPSPTCFSTFLGVEPPHFCTCGVPFFFDAGRQSADEQRELTSNDNQPYST